MPMTLAALWTSAAACPSTTWGLLGASSVTSTAPPMSMRRRRHLGGALQLYLWYRLTGAVQLYRPCLLRLLRQWCHLRQLYPRRLSLQYLVYLQTLPHLQRSRMATAPPVSSNCYLMASPSPQVPRVLRLMRSCWCCLASIPKLLQLNARPSGSCART